MVGNVAPLGNVGAIKPFVAPPKGDAGHVVNVNKGNIRQIVTTQSGESIVIPAMLGSETSVKPLKDGTYEVTTKPVVYGAKPKKTIMSEEEFIKVLKQTIIDYIKKEDIWNFLMKSRWNKEKGITFPVYQHLRLPVNQDFSGIPTELRISDQSTGNDQRITPPIKKPRITSNYRFKIIALYDI